MTSHNQIYSQQKFNSLTSKNPIIGSLGSHQKILWICDCGKETTASTRYVTSGRTKTCGRCNELTKEEIASMKFGSLRMKTPEIIHLGSNKRIEWVCDCGKTRIASMVAVKRGHITLCGKCNELSEEEISSTKFGKLRMKNPIMIKSGCHDKHLWVCDCGREKMIDSYSVLNGLSKSCGKCNEITASSFINKKYGRLQLKTPVPLMPSSTERHIWICECGQETTPVANKVLLGLTRSCGRCWIQIQEKFNFHKEKLRELKYPIQPEQVPNEVMVVLESIKGSDIPFKAQCQICKNEYHPRWGGVRNGISLTCGCSTHRISSGQKAIHDQLTALGINVELEHDVNGLKYDLFVQEGNLLIEYNGLKWHSYPDSKERDVKKYKNAIDKGFDYFSVFEDEWDKSNQKIIDLIVNRVGLNKPTGLRPSKCEIRKVSYFDADELYEKFHYIGRAKAPVNYGVFFEDNLIACVSFKHPTRQSKYPWELIRMVSDTRYRVHGIWNKLLKQFIQEYEPSSIVSFSDNRLFQGKVYEKLGFKFDGDVRPDYYWWKNKRRHHKSGLRKTNAEKLTGKTEIKLREAQGFKRVWDLGKKRWVLDIKRLHPFENEANASDL